MQCVDVELMDFIAGSNGMALVASVAIYSVFLGDHFKRKDYFGLCLSGTLPSFFFFSTTPFLRDNFPLHFTQNNDELTLIY